MSSIESNNIKALIDANVKSNGNNEITGSIMNSVLTAMITASLKGYHFQGILAADTTLPNNSPYFYLAIGPLTYNSWTWADGEIGYLAYTNEVGATPQRGTIALIDLIAGDMIAEHNDDPTAHQFILDKIDAIDDKIPAEASSVNQLADKQYVDDGLATKANDADVVHKAGAETISGVKNFSNGLQVSGQLLWYDTTNQCMRITFN